MLSDVEIRAAMVSGDIVITPEPQDSDMQPASIDVHLGGTFGLLLRPPAFTFVRLTDPSQVAYHDAEELVLGPGEFALGELDEHVKISSRFVARIEGKSSNGRKGLAIHVTAGFVDPGWNGILTVELFNASPITYVLRKGDPIGQLAFDRLLIPSDRPYGHNELGSHYQHSEGVKGS